MSVFSPNELGRRRCTKIDMVGVRVHDVSARHWLAHRVQELRSQLAVALFLVPSIPAPSPRQRVGDQELPPLAHHPQVPATTEQRIDIAERKDHHDV